MPETDAIPVSASTASVGKGIRYIGGRAYAYSGNLKAATSGTVFDFTSGAGLIAGGFYYTANADDAGTSYVTLDIKFNGTTILYSKERRDLGQFSEGLWRVIIPPLTRVEVTYIIPNTDTDLTVNFVGRVYGAE